MHPFLLVHWTNRSVNNDWINIGQKLTKHWTNIAQTWAKQIERKQTDKHIFHKLSLLLQGEER